MLALIWTVYSLSWVPAEVWALLGSLAAAIPTALVHEVERRETP